MDKKQPTRSVIAWNRIITSDLPPGRQALFTFPVDGGDCIVRLVDMVICTKQHYDDLVAKADKHDE